MSIDFEKTTHRKFMHYSRVFWRKKQCTVIICRYGDVLAEACVHFIEEEPDLLKKIYMRMPNGHPYRLVILRVKKEGRPLVVRK